MMPYQLVPLSQRGPLRVMFVITSMPVGGAETLLVNLIRRLDRRRFAPEVCCLKTLGPLGEQIAEEIPTHHGLLVRKYDLRVFPKLVSLLAQRQMDAVVTVGAGDKMFWGRLAARWAGLPVVISALHSTGWPDGIGRLNRLLTPLTDAFIGVAEAHGRHLVENEGFPREKVCVIPNGVDVERFATLPDDDALRRTLGLQPTQPTVGIVAALRPEKNHRLFLDVAKSVVDCRPEVRFLIVGDGPEREGLEQYSRVLGIAESVRFLGNRDDIPALLSVMDIFLLTSHIEANPVSILEAMAVGKPVIATNVGSVSESVRQGQTGYLVPPGDKQAIVRQLVDLIDHPLEAAQMGAAGRRCVVGHWSLDGMVRGYEQLMLRIYANKCGEELPPGEAAPSQEPAEPVAAP